MLHFVDAESAFSIELTLEEFKEKAKSIVGVKVFPVKPNGEWEEDFNEVNVEEFNLYDEDMCYHFDSFEQVVEFFAEVE